MYGLQGRGQRDVDPGNGSVTIPGCNATARPPPAHRLATPRLAGAAGAVAVAGRDGLPSGGGVARAAGFAPRRGVFLACGPPGTASPHRAGRSRSPAALPGLPPAPSARWPRSPGLHRTGAPGVTPAGRDPPVRPDPHGPAPPVRRPRPARRLILLLIPRSRPTRGGDR